MEIEYIKDHLSDPVWRLNNLYYIRNKQGKKQLFKPNKAQEKIIEDMWYLMVVPKARQLGMCLDPETKVLTADLRWVTMRDIQVGTEIISVDEHPPRKNKARRMKKAVVEEKRFFKRETYKIYFDDGTDIICTGKHPWLSQSPSQVHWKWRTLEDSVHSKGKGNLKVGTKIRKLTKETWGNEMSYEDGWISGMLDGEGSLAKKTRTGANVGISQVDGPVWDRLVKYFDDRGYHYRVERDTRKAGNSSKLGSKPVNKLVLSRADEVMKLIGTTRPSRFVDKTEWWEGKEIPYINGSKYVTITKIEYCGEREVCDLQTSAGTYVANSLVSHNTTFFALFYLDQILFSENKVAGIIAHKQEDMKRIFRGKILFALEQMHPWVRELIGKPVVETANEIVFKNGSSMFVSLSARSQTLNYLHISEFAYICAHDPNKADEIMRGAINSVEAGQMISIESTAEGRGGHFYNIVMEADKMKRQNAKLTELDFRLFFFPWWDEPNYQIRDSAHVHLSQDDLAYFKELKEDHNIVLSKEQMVWYAKKRKLMGKEGMFREYPSFLEEAFSHSLEGAYYAKEISLAYDTKRVGFFPYDPNKLVSVAWDLGMNDDTVLVFFQELGEEIRIIDEYSNNGFGLSHYTKLLLEKPYRYDKHILPHDAAVRDLSTGVSREQFLWDLGLRNTAVAQKASVQDGIEKVRQLFHRFRFHKDTTQNLIDSLQMYTKEFDKEKGVWRPNPRHDEHSHRADAVRVMALGLHGGGEKYFNEQGIAEIHIESFSF